MNESVKNPTEVSWRGVIFLTYYLNQQQRPSGSGGEVVVEGQGGGWRAALWSWGAPVGRHHSVSLHAALTGTVTPSGCWRLWQRKFLSGAPPRTSSCCSPEKKKKLLKYLRLLRCAGKDKRFQPIITTNVLVLEVILAQHCNIVFS